MYQGYKFWEDSVNVISSLKNGTGSSGLKEEVEMRCLREQTVRGPWDWKKDEEFGVVQVK